MPGQQSTVAGQTPPMLASSQSADTAGPTAQTPRPRFPDRAGMALAVISAVLGFIWAVSIAPLNAPDEPAYLQTVMQVRNEHLLPEVHFDFTHDPTGEVVSRPSDPTVRDYAAKLGFGEDYEPLESETVQPPLYFLIAGILAQFVSPTPAAVLYLGRFVSVLFGAGAVYFYWAATRQLAPRAPMWAVAAVGSIVLLPEFNFNNAHMANDSLVFFLGSAAFYLWLRGLRQPDYDRWMLGAGTLVGLAILSKLVGLVLLPALGLVVLFRAFQQKPRANRWRAVLRRGGSLATGAGASVLLTCGWWFVRNMIAYGEPSGMAASSAYWRLHLTPLNWNDLEVRVHFLLDTWMSLWGDFGWMTIQFPLSFYVVALGVTPTLLWVSILGVLVLIRRQGGLRSVPKYIWQTAAIMSLIAIASIISFLQFSLTVAYQPQGRYLYLVLLPAALALTGGLYALLPGRIPKTVAFSLLFVGLASLNIMGLGLVR